MTKRLIKKAVICAVLCFCLSTSIISIIQGEEPLNKQSIQDTNGMRLMGDETSVICGYVTDSVSGEPVEDVEVDLSWEDFDGNTGWNTTLTDVAGWYHFTTVPVEFRLNFHPENYFDEYTSSFTVWENQIFWYNASLIPVPEQTVRIQGYVTDNVTGAPIMDAFVNLNWYESGGPHYWHNYTSTNLSGYYSLCSIPGDTFLQVAYQDYFEYYSGDIYTQNNSVVWFNISLIPFPTATAIVCGFISDAQLGDPIPNVRVNLYCYTEYGMYTNYTFTDGIGFYSVGTVAGNVGISCSCPDYAMSSSQDHTVEENDTLWINLTMTYQPEETSKVKGYVVDSQTQAAVRNAIIRYNWRDDVGHFISKATFTDTKGYFLMTTPAGSVQFIMTGHGYSNQQTPWFFINEYSDIWMNVSLEPEISLVFEKPQPGIYINNESRFPFLSKILWRFFPQIKPLIIGPLEIAVQITNSTLGCNRVVFSIDDFYVKTDSEEPFTYDWNGTITGIHTIQVFAYDNAGPCRIETILVRKMR
jgi:5-hydroxyisourate hydrolase-like protein (transthyretin family)